VLWCVPHQHQSVTCDEVEEDKLQLLLVRW
jgi:hypothetical protein